PHRVVHLLLRRRVATKADQPLFGKQASIGLSCIRIDVGSNLNVLFDLIDLGLGLLFLLEGFASISTIGVGPRSPPSLTYAIPVGFDTLSPAVFVNGLVPPVLDVGPHDVSPPHSSNQRRTCRG